MNCFFLELDGMIENLVDPTLADIEFCYFVAFYYLPDEVVCLVEDCLQGIVLLFWTFVYLVQNFCSYFSEDFEQNITYFELHTDILNFLDWKKFSFDTLLTAILDILYESD